MNYIAHQTSSLITAELFIEQPPDRLSRRRPDHPLSLVSAFHYDEGRDALDVELFGKSGVLVHINYPDFHPPLILFSDDFNRRRDHAIWPRPRCSEMNQNGGLGSEHLSPVVSVSYLNDFAPARGRCRIRRRRRPRGGGDGSSRRGCGTSGDSRLGCCTYLSCVVMNPPGRTGSTPQQCNHQNYEEWLSTHR